MSTTEGSPLRPIELDVDDEAKEHDQHRAARKRAAPKLPIPIYKASVKDLATSSNAPHNSRIDDIDKAIIDRIKKCLDRANHPTTPEAEAKAALYMASRLMGRYNVSQSDVLAQADSESQQQYAGQSRVSITRTDGDQTKSVRQQHYVRILCCAMEKFFNCKCYTTARKTSVDVTFYGIAENTLATAISFEMVFNLIAEWARPYKGVGTKNSYCHGICDQLYRDAEKEQQKEEELAKLAELEGVKGRDEKEEAERKAELDRLVGPADNGGIEDSLSPSPESHVKDEDEDIDSEVNYDDDDILDGSFDEDGDADMEDFFQPTFKVEEDNFIDLTGDIDDEIDNLVKNEPLSSEEDEGTFDEPSTSIGPFHLKEEQKPDPALFSDSTTDGCSSAPKTEVDVGWRSHSQLVLFRNTAAKIAEEYLKEKSMKLRKGRKRKTEIRDRSAYRQGEKDSAKIDVRRKKIKNE